MNMKIDPIKSLLTMCKLNKRTCWYCNKNITHEDNFVITSHMTEIYCSQTCHDKLIGDLTDEC